MILKKKEMYKDGVQVITLANKTLFLLTRGNIQSRKSLWYETKSLELNYIKFYR